MSDQDINIRIQTAQTGPGLQPVIKDVEKLTEATKELGKAQQEQAKVLTGSSGLATAPPNPSLATRTRSPQEEKLRAQAEKIGLKADRLAAESERKAEQAALAKNLAGNVANVGEAASSAAGGGLRTALREGAQVAGLQGVGRALANLASPIGLIVAGFAAVAAGVRAAIGSMKAFTEERSKIRELNEALAVSGHFSNALSESIRKLAKEREANTGIDDGKWIAAYQELLHSGATAGQLGDLSNRLSELKVITGSLETATTLLSEAQRGNFDGFRKYGVYVDEHASQMEKLSLVYRQVATASGILEDSLSSGAKAGIEFKAAFKEASVGLGGFLSQFLTPAANSPLMQLTREFSKFMEEHTIPDIEADKKARSALVPIIFNQEAATRALNEQLEGQRAHMAAIEEFTNRSVESEKRAADSKKTAIDREKDYKLALIDAAEAAGRRNAPGGITAVAASLARLQITRRADVAKSSVDQTEKDREIAAKSKEAKFLHDHGGNVSDAEWNYKHASFLFEDAKQSGKVDGEKLKEMEADAEAYKLKLKEAREIAKKEREILVEIQKLKDEKAEGIKSAAGNIAIGDARARSEIANQHAEEITRQREAAQHGLPVPRLTPLRPRDTAIDPDFNHALNDAGALINPATPAPVRRPSSAHYGPDPDTAHVQPGQFGKRESTTLPADNSALEDLRRNAVQILTRKDGQFADLLKQLIEIGRNSSDTLDRHERDIRDIKSRERNHRAGFGS